MTLHRLTTWQFELWQSAMAAGTTIALRSSDALCSVAAGKRPDRREANRMAVEKAEALSQGLFAAGLACNRLWWKASLSGAFLPADAWLHLIRAASQPARVTVRRNARRLTRRGR